MYTVSKRRDSSRALIGNGWDKMLHYQGLSFNYNFCKRFLSLSQTSNVLRQLKMVCTVVRAFNSLALLHHRLLFHEKKEKKEQVEKQHIYPNKLYRTRESRIIVYHISRYVGRSRSCIRDGRVYR